MNKLLALFKRMAFFSFFIFLIITITSKPKISRAGHSGH